MSEPHVIRLRPDGPPGAGLALLGHCEAEDVIAGSPVETGHEYYADPSGQLHAGVWECTPYTARFAAYPVDECCLVLAGEVVITDRHGHAERFGAGECFLIPTGLECTWEITETLRKLYVIFERGQ